MLTDVLRISRPTIWTVSLLPYFTGFLLASHRFLPDSADGFRRLGTGALVFGPVLWLAVLAINDAIDLPGDLQNPRKDGSPLTQGRVTARRATLLADGAAVASLLFALSVGPGMAALAFGFLVLGWLYSVPPVRLKDRPGWDILANAIAVGAFALLAGWAAARPLGDFPWIFILEGVLVTTAVYVPTTLADYDADVASGYVTTAVRLGRARTHLIGLGAMTASCVVATWLAALDYYIPHRMLWIQVAGLVVIPAIYHAALGRARATKQVYRGILIVSWAFMTINAIFALMYVGWL